MFNLYTVGKSAAEVASHFGVAPPNVVPFNVDKTTELWTKARKTEGGGSLL